MEALAFVLRIVEPPWPPAVLKIIRTASVVNQALFLSASIV
jgi:hypothetical protein